MVGGMVGNKAVATGALFQQQPKMISKSRVITGAKSFKFMFENIGACHIGKGYGR